MIGRTPLPLPNVLVNLSKAATAATSSSPTIWDKPVVLEDTFDGEAGDVLARLSSTESLASSASSSNPVGLSTRSVPIVRGNDVVVGERVLLGCKRGVPFPVAKESVRVGENRGDEV